MRSAVTILGIALHAIRIIKSGYFAVSAVAFIAVLDLAYYQHWHLAIIVAGVLSALHAFFNRSKCDAVARLEAERTKYAVKLYSDQAIDRENNRALVYLIHNIVSYVKRDVVRTQKDHPVSQCITQMCELLYSHKTAFEYTLDQKYHAILYRLIACGFLHYCVSIETPRHGLHEFYLTVLRQRSLDTKCQVFPLVLCIITTVAKDNHITLIGEGDGKPKQEVVC